MPVMNRFIELVSTGTIDDLHKLFRLSDNSLLNEIDILYVFIELVQRAGIEEISDEFYERLELEFDVNTEWLKTGVGKMTLSIDENRIHYCFCGGHAELAYKNSNPPEYCVACMSCERTGSKFSNKEQAIENWNELIAAVTVSGYLNAYAQQLEEEAEEWISSNSSKPLLDNELIVLDHDLDKGE